MSIVGVKNRLFIFVDWMVELLYIRSFFAGNYKTFA